MTLPVNRPLDEVYLSEGTTSIATTPVVAQCVVPAKGYVERVFAASTGTTTGTITVAVFLNQTTGGTDILGSALTIAAGAGFSANSNVVELSLIGAGTTSGVAVNEGDVLLISPTGGTGSTIGGAFTIVIRKDN